MDIFGSTESVFINDVKNQDQGARIANWRISLEREVTKNLYSQNWLQNSNLETEKYIKY